MARPYASLLRLPDLAQAKKLRRRGRSEWSLDGVRGRLVELSGAEDSAALTLAFGLVLEAQLREEPVAWVTLQNHGFFPPDASEAGVDLDALAVVRVPRVRDLSRAADPLARSGAFGLVLLDVADVPVPMPVQSRLLGLAQKHDLALVFLTSKPPGSPSLGSLISLRAQTSRRRTAPGRFVCELKALKDKRRTPGWRHVEVCRGPAGMH